MKFLSSLDLRDRKLLLWSVGIAISLAILTGILLPNGDNNDNAIPSSYLAGKHGALAAYETLVRSGYPVERWERPLEELAATANPSTVVIFAQPFTREVDEIKAVRQIIEHGGRVLSTGFWGGYILPSGAANPPSYFNFAACKLEPEGLDPLASSGEVWMVPEATWQVGDPAIRTQYSCAAQPAVVEYNWGNGHVVWWASSTPLENASLSRAQNLDLLLNSIGPREGHHFYWDESLHGEIRSEWTYAGGPALLLLRIGLPVLAFIVVFSFSRRSGPVRELAQPVRTTPIEFVEALGALYRNAGAASTAVSVALDRFRRNAQRLCGVRTGKMSAEELAAALRRRFPTADSSLEADLAACEEAAGNDSLKSREGLRLVQLLIQHLDRLQAAALPAAKTASAVPSSSVPQNQVIPSNPKERVS
jgi:hypothetical protein